MIDSLFCFCMNHLSLLGIKWIFLHLIFKETKKSSSELFSLIMSLNCTRVITTGLIIWTLTHLFIYRSALKGCLPLLHLSHLLPHPPTLLKLTSVLPFLANLPLPRVTSSLFLENFTWVMFYYARCSEDLRSSTYCCQCGSAKVSLQRKKYRWKPPSVCLSFFFFLNLNLSHLFFQSVVLIRGPLRDAASQHVLQFAILWFCDSVWRNQLLWGPIHAITRVSAGLQEFQASELANVRMYTFTPLQI